MQIFANSILFASIYLIIGLGFFIIYRVTRFFHFGHGIVFTAGAYLSFLFKVWFSFPIVFSVILGILLSALLGCLMEICIYRPLRHKNASSLILLLSALGIYIVLQNIISILFGDDIKTIRSGAVDVGANILGARLTSVQIATIIAAICLFMLCLIFLKFSKIGQAIRAVANDPELAEISGIASDTVILLCFCLGSGLAGVAGVLMALDVDMSPTMGMNALLMAVVAVIVGGTGSISGLGFGALLLGIARHIGIWKLGSQWQDAFPFIILLVFLLFRPQGFFGKPVKNVNT